MRAGRLRATVRTTAGVVAGMVAAVALAGGVLSGATVAAAGSPVTSSAAAAPVADVALDQGDLGRLAALRHCATSSFAADPDAVRVLYGCTAEAAARSYPIRVENVASPAATRELKAVLRGAGLVLASRFRGEARTEEIDVALPGKTGEDVMALLEPLLDAFDVVSLDSRSAILRAR